MGIKDDELLARFLKFGLLLKNAKQDPSASFIRRDNVGNEVDASELLGQILKDPNFDPGIVLRNSVKLLGFIEFNIARTKRGRLRMNLPGPIANEFTEFANMHHTSLEKIMSGTLKLAVNASNEEMRHSHSYILRDTQGENHISLFY